MLHIAVCISHIKCPTMHCSIKVVVTSESGRSDQDKNAMTSSREHNGSVQHSNCTLTEITVYCSCIWRLVNLDMKHEI